ncbi:MAG TPA: DUF5996 family protein [Enhygromyxa sp.]|nr:DUF5996 family protein [Enhygromyxa sp.]
MSNTAWPALPLADWEPTYKTLHRWAQMLGKLRIRMSAPINHWWHSTLHFQARGLTTTPMPIGDARQLEITLDFVDHQLRLQTSDGETRSLALEPRSVASFYTTLFAELRSLGVSTFIWPMPVEIPHPVRFDHDHENASYEPEQVGRMWTILRSVHDVFARSRSEFVGKCSPVHFFWGAFDLALTRFSGRRNPNPPSDPIMREGYSHELISHGFWFGGDWPNGARVEQPAFYAYAVPQPEGFATAKVLPAAARYDPTFSEFLLPYDAIREAADPAAELLAFMRSTYEAGAELARWDRVNLERD